MVSAVLDSLVPAAAAGRDALLMQLVSDADGAMRAFLDDQTTMVYQATLSGGAVKCSNVVSFDTTSSAQVVLTKLKSGALTTDDIPTGVAVSSMAGGSLRTSTQLTLNLFPLLLLRLLLLNLLLLLLRLLLLLLLLLLRASICAYTLTASRAGSPDIGWSARAH